MSFLWRVDRAEGRGRLLRTTRAVRAGECVLQEKPYGLVALNVHRSALCAVCLRAADPDVCCDDCSRVFFCSDECRERLQEVHERECMALEEVELVAKKTSVEVDLLRLLIRILAVRPSDSLDQDVLVDDDGSVVTTFAKVREMIHALDQQPTAWQERVRDGAARIMEDLPDECHLPVGDILVLAAQINENSYALGALDDRHLVASVGLFPIMGLINHSCAPNCGWSNAGDGAVALHALRDLKEGEEITLSYIDIDKERSERRRELQETKHFDCACERCSEPLAESVDRFLEGFVCPRCPSKEQALLIAAGDKAVCQECQFDLPLAPIEAAVRGSRDTVLKAKQLLNQFQYQAVVNTLSDVHQGVVVHGSKVSFHSGHSVAIAARRTLSDAHFKLGNLEQALALREQVVSALQLVSGASHLPLAIAHLDYADTIRRLTRLLTAPLAAHLDFDSLERAMQDSYREFKAICDVCLPAVHPLRQFSATAAEF